MAIVLQVMASLQGLLDESMDELARDTGCVQRQRKFSGSTLLSTLVLTVLQNPEPEVHEYQTTASQLDVHVTEEAIKQRFTSELVRFLEAAIPRLLERVLQGKAPPIELVNRFEGVLVGDSTTITLPDVFADRFPGCGGSHGSGKAALKIQVVWDLRCGQLQLLLEPGRASDAKSPITERAERAGCLSIFDLGYFSIERYQRIEQAGGYWLSRLQHGTHVYDAEGKQVDLKKFLAKQAQRGVVDASVLIGQQRLPCRLVAMRVTPEIAARRRQKAREKARDHGREPSQEHLELLEWVIFVTNCLASLLTWQEVVVLYRARWQIERLFKLWKSFNGLDKHNVNALALRQLAELYAKLIAVVLQHGILLMTVWLDGRRSLWRAAKNLRAWVGQIIGAIDDGAKLRRVLNRLCQALHKSARINSRRKHPSCFQLLNNPGLLEYTTA